MSANDSDADGDALSATLVKGPAKGKLTLNADGTFTYTPPKNFVGTESFTYKQTDGEDHSNVAMVAIKVGSTKSSASKNSQNSWFFKAADYSHGHDVTHDQAPAPVGTDKFLFSERGRPSQFDLAILTKLALLFRSDSDLHSLHSQHDGKSSAVQDLISHLHEGEHNVPTAEDHSHFSTGHDAHFLLG